jgi:hypothetical protein
MSSNFEKIHNSQKHTTDNLYTLHPRGQLVLIFISLLLFYVYWCQLFADPNHNLIMLYFSIVNTLWWVTIFVRYIVMGFDLSIPSLQTNTKPQGILIHVPDAFRCPFGEITCQKGHVTYWTIIHFFVYFILGILVPGYYGMALLISIICEMIESGLFMCSKFFVDPMVNMFGYFMGNLTSMALNQGC